MTKRNRFKIVNNIESCNVVEMLCPRSSQPPIPSSLLTADCTIQYALPLLWNQFILSTHPNNYPYSWQSVGVGFSMVFVCLFFCISQKKATRIIKLDTNMLHNESWKSIYFKVKKVTGEFTSNKNHANMGHCTLVSAGFFSTPPRSPSITPPLFIPGWKLIRFTNHSLPFFLISWIFSDQSNLMTFPVFPDL